MSKFRRHQGPALMIDSVLGRILFYPVLLIPGKTGWGRRRPGPFRWGESCETAKLAREVVDKAIESDGASMASSSDSRSNKRVMFKSWSATRDPEWVRKIVNHYVQLCDLIDQEHPDA